jgi:hypothetical protein
VLLTAAAALKTPLQPITETIFSPTNPQFLSPGSVEVLSNASAPFLSPSTEQFFSQISDSPEPAANASSSLQSSSSLSSTPAVTPPTAQRVNIPQAKQAHSMMMVDSAISSLSPQLARSIEAMRNSLDSQLVSTAPRGLEARINYLFIVM